MAGWRVLFVLIGGALVGCAGGHRELPTPELRTPQELAMPAADAWGRAATALATDLASGIAARKAEEPASLASIEGSAPAYFRDVLLANLIAHGARMAEPGTATSLAISCRATPVGVVPVPRGQITGPFALPGEILVLCLLTQNGVYVAAAHQSLSLPSTPPPQPTGVVLGITE